MPRRPGLLALLALLLAAHDARAQSLMDLLQSIQRGGGWVNIPIRGGEGQLRTATLPALGLSLTGCMRVWHGHSGRWSIRARDVLGPGTLEADVGADEPVPFSYAPAGRAQLEVTFRWSEPRDTTLILWVGLSSASSARDPCQPVYGDEAAHLVRTPGRDSPREAGAGPPQRAMAAATSTTVSWIPRKASTHAGS